VGKVHLWGRPTWGEGPFVGKAPILDVVNPVPGKAVQNENILNPCYFEAKKKKEIKLTESKFPSLRYRYGLH
jgi:hypothetical protein